MRRIRFRRATPWLFPVLALLVATAAGAVEVTGGGGPGGRHKPTIVVDTARGRLLLFGGLHGETYPADVWTMSLDEPGRWTRLETRGNGPAGRFGHTAIYDPVRDRMIVYGGAVGGRPDGGVWALLLAHDATWRRITPSGTPPAARFAHTAVYDPARDRMLVFGGYDGGFLDDTWALSLGTLPAWSRLAAAGAPPGRNAHAAIYDPKGRRMIVQGGYDGRAALDDTWALGLSRTLRWTRIEASSPPPPRRQHAAVCDARRDRMLVFGGTVNGADAGYGDAWVLSLDGDPAWRPVETTGAGPPPRWGPALAFDAAHDAVFVFGGTHRSGWFDDTWRLALSPAPHWTRVPEAAP